MVAPPWIEVPPRGYGGIEAICATLIDALAERGHDITLIGAGGHSTAATQFLATYDQPQFARLGEAIPELVHTARANSLLATRAFDVVHDHTTAGPLTACHRLAPTVATVHGNAGSEFGDIYDALGGAVKLVAISDAQRALRPELPWIGTVHNSLRPEAFPLRHKKEGYVLWLARFCADKGPDLAIEACREAGLPLVLAGKCSEPAEHAYFDEVIKPMMGPDVEVVLDGERSLVVDLLASARCLLLPLRWPEPFGMVLIEAMACGTPVVALGRGAVPEIVKHGETGIVCDQLAELPDALHAVTAMDPAACRAHVERSFSAGAMAAGYEAIYRAVAER
jgi:glycosyltransferase involved in cell wall biosynthesis